MSFGLRWLETRSASSGQWIICLFYFLSNVSNQCVRLRLESHTLEKRQLQMYVHTRYKCILCLTWGMHVFISLCTFYWKLSEFLTHFFRCGRPVILEGLKKTKKTWLFCWCLHWTVPLHARWPCYSTTKQDYKNAMKMQDFKTFPCV